MNKPTEETKIDATAALRRTRSDFLVHWTGHKFDKPPRKGPVTPEIREQYVNRLKSVLENGFYLYRQEKPEAIAAAEWGKYEYNVSLTCFSEVRLSYARDHAQRYGRLGIGVRRSFVLDRCGTPAWYVRNRAPESIVSALFEVWLYLATSTDQSTATKRTRLDHAMSMLKPMSDSEGQEDFTYLEEHEWRIVFNHEAKKLGRIVETGKDNPRFRVPITADDLRVLVFPDDLTRSEALDDNAVKCFLDKAQSPTILLTIDECEQL